MKNKRSEAIEVGDMYYKTGKECIRGHFSKRMTIDGSCFECRLAYNKKQREMIREKIIEAS